MDPLTIKSRDTVADERFVREDIEPTQTHNPENDSSFIGEIFKFALLALIIVIPFRLFIAQPFIVSGASMSPTFETGEYIIVDQVT